MTFYIDTKKSASPKEICHFLQKCISRHTGKWSELVFICIGTDRITGDCLGPYIGEQLKNHKSDRVFVYGTLHHPIHALNLPEMTANIKKAHPHALFIAIDASLGKEKHLGYVTIENGALHPGAGVHKNLPPVGDIHITGVVNTAGLLEQLTLQTTRLSFVISMAEKITQGILACIPCAYIR